MGEGREKERDKLSSDNNVVFSQFFLRNISRFTVIEIPSEPLRSDMSMKLVCPIRRH